MIDNLRELNEKINAFVNYVVKTACEQTSSGQYYVSADDACKAAGMSFEDFLLYKEIVVGELHERKELLDFDFDEKTNEFDLNCALNYCPNYEWVKGDESIFGSYERFEKREILPVGIESFNDDFPRNDFRVGKWRVHIVPPGGTMIGCINDTSQTFVEFLDMSANKDEFPNGQFVSRYFLESLLCYSISRPGKNFGLTLVNDVPDWMVTGKEMVQINDWLRKRELLPGEHYFWCSGDVDVSTWMMERSFGPDGYVPKMAGEILLGEVLTPLPFVHNLSIEHIGEYCNGQGYSVSFCCQHMNSTLVVKILNEALESFSHDFDVCIEKVVPVEKPSLDIVIDKCEKMNKKADVVDINKYRTSREEI